MNSHKNIAHFLHHLSTLRIQARKKDPKVKKLKHFSISFYVDFQVVFGKSCIFPMEQIYQLIWEKYDFYKKGDLNTHKNWWKVILLKLAFFQKRENGHILKNKPKKQNLRVLSFSQL